MKESRQQGTYSEWRNEPDIPYKILCTFNMPDTMLLETIPLDQRHPARALLTPDLPGTTHTVSMFFHQSIPQEFLEIVYYHEKVEAAAVHGDQKLSSGKAHQLAVLATEKYVRENHGQAQLEKFLSWSKSLSQ